MSAAEKVDEMVDTVRELKYAEYPLIALSVLAILWGRKMDQISLTHQRYSSAYLEKALE